jgi:hypothetical protein
MQTGRETGRLTDMTKLMVAFRSFSNEHDKCFTQDLNILKKI